MNWSSGAKRMVIRNLQGNSEGTVSIEEGRKPRIRKQLTYNYKSVSSLILRAKTPGSAQQAVAQARAQAARLHKKQLSGDYDEREVEIALIHAEQVVRIAKKKETHLSEEERAKKEVVFHVEETIDPIEKSRMRYAREAPVTSREDYSQMVKKLQKILKKLNDELARELKKTMDAAFDLSEDELPEEIDPAYFSMIKKRHRADEFREITKADMDYLKQKFSVSVQSLNRYDSQIR